MPETNKSKERFLSVILLTVFVDLLGFGILIPVIPLLLAAPNSPYFLLPAGDTIKQGFILLGYLTAIYPLMQFLAAPILGELSDRFGRKPILAICLLGTCISYIIFAFGILDRSLLLLFLARAFDGITGGNISVAQAAIADVTIPEHRAKNFGLLGAAFGLGFIIGPYLGGKLSDPAVLHWFTATTPFWFAAILSFVNVLSLTFIFQETNEHHSTDLHLHPAKAVTNIVRAFQLPNLSLLFFVIFLFQAGFTFFTTFFSVFLIQRLGFTQGNIGDFFSFVGLWVVFAQAVVTRFVAARFSERQVLQVSLPAMTVMLFVILWPHHTWQLYATVPFFAIFNGLCMANLSAQVSRLASGKIQGEVLGLMAGVQSAAQVIPPVLSGYIAASLTPSAPIIVSGTVAGVAALIFLFFFQPPRVSEPAPAS